MIPWLHWVVVSRGLPSWGESIESIMENFASRIRIQPYLALLIDARFEARDVHSLQRRFSGAEVVPLQAGDSRYRAKIHLFVLGTQFALSPPLYQSSIFD